MGLIGAVKWLVHDLGASRVLENAAFDGEDVWLGSDDLWPEEPARLQLVAESHDDDPPVTIKTLQWGLVLPGGETMWNTWQGINFDHPLGRLKMIATLQKTALDMGFAQEQVSEFLEAYSWATRYQVAAVVYEDSDACSLTDPAVTASGTESPDDMEYDRATDSPDHLPGDLHLRSVGSHEE
jgi:hypothetical protein